MTALPWLPIATDMGSYAQCWLDDLFVGACKNDIDLNLISLFRPADKVIERPNVDTLPVPLAHYRESLEEDEELELVYYRTSIAIIRDRLDVLGYRREPVESAFEEWIKREHQSTLASMEKYLHGDTETDARMAQHYCKIAEILSSLTTRTWIESLKTIHADGLKPNQFGRYEGPHADTIVGYMLSNEWYGFPGHDLFVPLRLAIEACENGQSLIYDVTDLVWSDYFDAGTDLVQYGIDAMAADYSTKAKTVVLTEGKTDAWILRESLTLLYPHLQDYFSFLDFESSGFGGGVGNLTNVVKAFAGSGIVNNVIALFDNDTAAAAAFRTLEAISLPANIAIVRLPPLALLSNYPTLGPSGALALDVNGIAASIELYLGEDVLRDSSGELTPVQWTGYDKTLNRYQGEVLDKCRLQDRFKAKLARPPSTDSPAWEALKNVLNTLFSAFSERNRTAILHSVSEYYDEDV